MRHWLCTMSATALLASGSAFAADLGRGPPLAPVPPPAPLFTWTGFYLGAQVGYAWAQDTDTEALSTGVADGWSANSKPNGVKGGGFVGYNWQMGSWVVGLEADAEAAGVKGTGVYSNSGFPPVTDNVVSNTDFQGSIRGRLGYAVDRLLVYGTGGAAFADTNYTYTDAFIHTINPGPPQSSTATRLGWTLGAGLEYAVTNNWTVRAEYRYADFGTVTNTETLFVGSLEKQHLTESVVRLGIAYKF